MNRKRQLLREFFLNAMTIALMKQIIVAGIADEARGTPRTPPADAADRHSGAEVPPYFQG